MKMPKPIHVFALSAAVASLGENIVAPYLPLFIASLTSSPSEVGLLVAVVSLAGVLAQLLWGFAGDSLSRRKPFMVFGNVFKGLFYFVISYAASVKQLLFSQASQSFLSGMGPPNSNALLAKLTPSDKWSRTSAALETIGKVSAIPAILLGGWIVGNYGIRAMFLPAAFFLAVSGVLFFALREPVRNGKKAGVITRSVFAELKQNRGFRFLLLGTFIWAFGMNLVSPLVPTLIFAVKLHFGAGELALLSAIAVITALVLTIPAGVLADRYGSRIFVAFAYSLGTAIILGYIFASTLWHVAILVFLSAVAGAAGGGATFSLVSKLSPPSMRGSLMGLFALAVGLTSATAPALGGVLWSTLGFSATFLLAALLHTVGGLIIYFRTTG